MSHITQLYGYENKELRRNPVPSDFNWTTATWAQLEAILFDRPTPTGGER